MFWQWIINLLEMDQQHYNEAMVEHQKHQNWAKEKPLQKTANWGSVHFTGT